MAKKILLIDDEPDVQQVISFRLEKAGYEVIVTDRAAEALDLVPRERPDVILLDVMMPGEDGFEVCREIKTRHPHQRVIIYTAKIEGVDAARARAVGADGFTVKTADLAYILEAIERAGGPE